MMGDEDLPQEIQRLAAEHFDPNKEGSIVHCYNIAVAEGASEERVKECQSKIKEQLGAVKNSLQAYNVNEQEFKKYLSEKYPAQAKIYQQIKKYRRERNRAARNKIQKNNSLGQSREDVAKQIAKKVVATLTSIAKGNVVAIDDLVKDIENSSTNMDSSVFILEMQKLLGQQPLLANYQLHLLGYDKGLVAPLTSMLKSCQQQQQAKSQELSYAQAEALEFRVIRMVKHLHEYVALTTAEEKNAFLQKRKDAFASMSSLDDVTFIVKMNEALAQQVFPAGVTVKEMSVHDELGEALTKLYHACDEQHQSFMRHLDEANQAAPLMTMLAAAVAAENYAVIEAIVQKIVDTPDILQDTTREELQKAIDRCQGKGNSPAKAVIKLLAPSVLEKSLPLAAQWPQGSEQAKQGLAAVVDKIKQIQQSLVEEQTLSMDMVQELLSQLEALPDHLACRFDMNRLLSATVGFSEIDMSSRETMLNSVHQGLRNMLAGDGNNIPYTHIIVAGEKQQALLHDWSLLSDITAADEYQTKVEAALAGNKLANSIINMIDDIARMDPMSATARKDIQNKIHLLVKDLPDDDTQTIIERLNATLERDELPGDFVFKALNPADDFRMQVQNMLQSHFSKKLEVQHAMTAAKVFVGKAVDQVKHAEMDDFGGKFLQELTAYLTIDGLPLDEQQVAIKEITTAFMDELKKAGIDTQGLPSLEMDSASALAEGIQRTLHSVVLGNAVNLEEPLARMHKINESLMIISKESPITTSLAEIQSLYLSHGLCKHDALQILQQKFPQATLASYPEFSAVQQVFEQTQAQVIAKQLSPLIESISQAEGEEELPDNIAKQVLDMLDGTTITADIVKAINAKVRAKSCFTVFSSDPLPDKHAISDAFVAASQQRGQAMVREKEEGQRIAKDIDEFIQGMCSADVNSFDTKFNRSQFNDLLADSVAKIPKDVDGKAVDIHVVKALNQHETIRVAAAKFAVDANKVAIALGIGEADKSLVKIWDSQYSNIWNGKAEKLKALADQAGLSCPSLTAPKTIDLAFVEQVGELTFALRNKVDADIAVLLENKELFDFCVPRAVGKEHTQEEIASFAEAHNMSDDEVKEAIEQVKNLFDLSDTLNQLLGMSQTITDKMGVSCSWEDVCQQWEQLKEDLDKEGLLAKTHHLPDLDKANPHRLLEAKHIAKAVDAFAQEIHRDASVAEQLGNHVDAATKHMATAMRARFNAENPVAFEQSYKGMLDATTVAALVAVDVSSVAAQIGDLPGDVSHGKLKHIVDITHTLLQNDHEHFSESERGIDKRDPLLSRLFNESELDCRSAKTAERVIEISQNALCLARVQLMPDVIEKDYDRPLGQIENSGVHLVFAADNLSLGDIHKKEDLCRQQQLKSSTLQENLVRDNAALAAMMKGFDEQSTDSLSTIIDVLQDELDDEDNTAAQKKEVQQLIDFLRQPDLQAQIRRAEVLQHKLAAVQTSCQVARAKIGTESSLSKATGVAKDAAANAKKNVSKLSHQELNQFLDETIGWREEITTGRQTIAQQREGLLQHAQAIIKHEASGGVTSKEAAALSKTVAEALAELDNADQQLLQAESDLDMADDHIVARKMEMFEQYYQSFLRADIPAMVELLQQSDSQVDEALANGKMPGRLLAKVAERIGCQATDKAAVSKALDQMIDDMEDLWVSMQKDAHKKQETSATERTQQTIGDTGRFSEQLQQAADVATVMSVCDDIDENSRSCRELASQLDEEIKALDMEMAHARKALDGKTLTQRTLKVTEVYDAQHELKESLVNRLNQLIGRADALDELSVAARDEAKKLSDIVSVHDNKSGEYANHTDAHNKSFQLQQEKFVEAEQTILTDTIPMAGGFSAMRENLGLKALQNGLSEEKDQTQELAGEQLSRQAVIEEINDMESAFVNAMKTRTVLGEPFLSARTQEVAQRFNNSAIDLQEQHNELVRMQSVVSQYLVSLNNSESAFDIHEKHVAHIASQSLVQLEADDGTLVENAMRDIEKAFLPEGNEDSQLARDWLSQALNETYQSKNLAEITPVEASSNKTLLAAIRRNMEFDLKNQHQQKQQSLAEAVEGYKALIVEISSAKTDRAYGQVEGNYEDRVQVIVAKMAGIVNGDWQDNAQVYNKALLLKGIELPCVSSDEKEFSQQLMVYAKDELKQSKYFIASKKCDEAAKPVLKDAKARKTAPLNSMQAMNAALGGTVSQRENIVRQRQAIAQLERSLHDSSRDFPGQDHRGFDLSLSQVATLKEKRDLSLRNLANAKEQLNAAEASLNLADDRIIDAKAKLHAEDFSMQEKQLHDAKDVNAVAAILAKETETVNKVLPQLANENLTDKLAVKVAEKLQVAASDHASASRGLHAKVGDTLHQWVDEQIKQHRQADVRVAAQVKQAIFGDPLDRFEQKIRRQPDKASVAKVQQDIAAEIKVCESLSLELGTKKDSVEQAISQVNAALSNGAIRDDRKSELRRLRGSLMEQSVDLQHNIDVLKKTAQELETLKDKATAAIHKVDNSLSAIDRAVKQHEDVERQHADTCKKLSEQVARLTEPGALATMRQNFLAMRQELKQTQANSQYPAAMAAVKSVKTRLASEVRNSTGTTLSKQFEADKVANLHERLDGVTERLQEQQHDFVVMQAEVDRVEGLFGHSERAFIACERGFDNIAAANLAVLKDDSKSLLDEPMADIKQCLDAGDNLLTRQWFRQAFNDKHGENVIVEADCLDNASLLSAIHRNMQVSLAKNEQVKRTAHGKAVRAYKLVVDSISHAKDENGLDAAKRNCAKQLQVVVESMQVVANGEWRTGTELFNAGIDTFAAPFKTAIDADDFHEKLVVYTGFLVRRAGDNLQGLTQKSVAGKTFADAESLAKIDVSRLSGGMIDDALSDSVKQRQAVVAQRQEIRQLRVAIANHMSKVEDSPHVSDQQKTEMREQYKRTESFLNGAEHILGDAEQSLDNLDSNIIARKAELNAGTFRSYRDKLSEVADIPKAVALLQQERKMVVSVAEELATRALSDQLAVAVATELDIAGGTRGAVSKNLHTSVANVLQDWAVEQIKQHQQQLLDANVLTHQAVGDPALFAQQLKGASSEDEVASIRREITKKVADCQSALEKLREQKTSIDAAVEAAAKTLDNPGLEAGRAKQLREVYTSLVNLQQGLAKNIEQLDENMQALQRINQSSGVALSDAKESLHDFEETVKAYEDHAQLHQQSLAQTETRYGESERTVLVMNAAQGGLDGMAAAINGLNHQLGAERVKVQAINLKDGSPLSREQAFNGVASVKSAIANSVAARKTLGKSFAEGEMEKLSKRLDAVSAGLIQQDSRIGQGQTQVAVLSSTVQASQAAVAVHNDLRKSIANKSLHQLRDGAAALSQQMNQDVMIPLSVPNINQAQATHWCAQALGVSANNLGEHLDAEIVHQRQSKQGIFDEAADAYDDLMREIAAVDNLEKFYSVYQSQQARLSKIVAKVESVSNGEWLAHSQMFADKSPSHQLSQVNDKQDFVQQLSRKANQAMHYAEERLHKREKLLGTHAGVTVLEVANTDLAGVDAAKQSAQEALDEIMGHVEDHSELKDLSLALRQTFANAYKDHTGRELSAGESKAALQAGVNNELDYHCGKAYGKGMSESIAAVAKQTTMIDLVSSLRLAVANQQQLQQALGEVDNKYMCTGVADEYNQTLHQNALIRNATLIHAFDDQERHAVAESLQKVMVPHKQALQQAEEAQQSYNGSSLKLPGKDGPTVGEFLQQSQQRLTDIASHKDKLSALVTDKALYDKEIKPKLGKNKALNKMSARCNEQQDKFKRISMQLREQQTKVLSKEVVDHLDQMFNAKSARAFDKLGAKQRQAEITKHLTMVDDSVRREIVLRINEKLEQENVAKLAGEATSEAILQKIQSWHDAHQKRVLRIDRGTYRRSEGARWQDYFEPEDANKASISFKGANIEGLDEFLQQNSPDGKTVTSDTGLSYALSYDDDGVGKAVLADDGKLEDMTEEQYQELRSLTMLQMTMAVAASGSSTLVVKGSAVECETIRLFAEMMNKHMADNPEKYPGEDGKVHQLLVEATPNTEISEADTKEAERIMLKQLQGWNQSLPENVRFQEQEPGQLLQEGNSAHVLDALKKHADDDVANELFLNALENECVAREKAQKIGVQRNVGLGRAG